MDRRDFIKYLLATPIAAELDIEKLLWQPTKTIWIPSQAQLDHMKNPNIPWLYGIPYHNFNASTRVWLGFDRLHEEIQSSWSGFVTANGK